ncbi:ParB/RepB/Spo0J family partition protein [Candidatus Liberibacter americanus]|uniref:Stage 0 sporulation protein J n=1 Tax=Candidatus Liberibacter americanus str. Sao Paulo TaxID=1261131 RepID=U6B390_9HYPH|nr:ParB/RepB/Spo0J family partition protein [Candidatus Liberibacter americanus]AHA27524.1 Stage 0 sporulation protein J [Candidatus Liberibacter americanus str. Sao Paulo]EMS36514.1 chromosome partitioning protein B [Candidatus Liberibacter americanus PW_SP]
MSINNSKRRLGRGLAALIGEVDQSVNYNEEKQRESTSSEKYIPIEFIVPNPNNPRDTFDDEDLKDLSNSIICHGIVQPIIVCPIDNGLYKIIAGERRFRAAKIASLSEIPVIIRNINEKSSLEIAIVENVQRKDLNPLEEALGYEKLISEYGYTQNDLGLIIGKSRSHIANILRILKLPDLVKKMILTGDLSLGHARALISTNDPLSLAKIVVSKKMSVREIEELVKNKYNKSIDDKKSFKNNVGMNNNLTDLEKIISSKLGLAVSIKCRDNKGQVCIKYKTIEQLDVICSLLGKD